MILVEIIPFAAGLAVVTDEVRPGRETYRVASDRPRRVGEIVHFDGHDVFDAPPAVLLAYLRRQVTLALGDCRELTDSELITLASHVRDRAVSAESRLCAIDGGAYSAPDPLGPNGPMGGHVRWLRGGDAHVGDSAYVCGHACIGDQGRIGR